MAHDEQIEGEGGHRAADGASLVRVRWSPSLDDARAVARQLVEHGLGARVEPAAPPDGAGYEVQVLADEATRAAELLGDAEPAAAAEDGEGVSAAAPVPWRNLVLIALAAMIVLPLVAGFLTYLIMRG